MVQTPQSTSEPGADEPPASRAGNQPAPRTPEHAEAGDGVATNAAASVRTDDADSATPAAGGQTALQPSSEEAATSGATAAAGVPSIGDLPERPLLAPEVKLSGLMGESGFRDKQWLVERNGRFIQLTALLYKIAEQANGEHTTAEIAASVSAGTGRKVSAANVEQLLAKKLIPLGLVLKADGSSAAPAADGGGARSLRVNMKMAHVPPRLINPLTSVLKLLYLPPVLLAVIAAGCFAEFWVFFVHGIGGSMHDALTAPGLLLAALGIIIVAAAFHELGHAAALRYGGGEVRGMGAGIYLVYPVFYTDVSDNYRLGRWSRVRTDLGGFYFNLLFALGVMALYLVTHSQFLLLVVVLIDFDIVRQLMPFVRLDGYWALADLTGIPDFFSQMGPFLRTVLPLPGWKGRKLPNLKLWVKIVYVVYILVTVPLLLVLMLATVKSLPRVLATAWVTYARLFAELGSAWGTTDLLGMLAAAVQILTLTLPTAGMLFIVYTLGRSLFGGIWRWSQPTLARRLAGTAIMAALAAFIGFLWLPQIPGLMPGFGGRSNPVYARNAFQPIAASERGTLGDAVSGLPVLGTRFSSQAVAPAAQLSTPRARLSPTPSVSTTPAVVDGGGAATATARVSPTPTASETATPAPSATATPTASATVSPTATATLRSAAPAAAPPTSNAPAAAPRAATPTTAVPLAVGTAVLTPAATVTATRTPTPAATRPPTGTVVRTNTPTPTPVP